MAITKIGSRAILDGSVAAADFADGTITNAKLAGSIGNDKLANSAITIGGEAISLGGTDNSLNLIDWQSVVTSDGSTVTTMVAGRGYFVDNSSAAGIVKLPASATIGQQIAIKDYAENFGTNNLTIQRNGHNIQGEAADSKISTNRASVVLVYVDSTKGWLFDIESNVTDFGPTYIAATGGTTTTSGDYKIHTFTGDGNFVVSSVGTNQSPSDSNNKVAYVVVAGGGGGNNANFGVPGGAGGAGGYREGKPSADPYSASPIAATSGLTVSAQTYPITVGGAGGGGPSPVPGQSGSNSVFSTITSAGGGRGGVGSQGSCAGDGGSGGSGGGGGSTGINPATPGLGAPGAGNTPPVSPSQGNNGGQGFAFQGHSFGSGGGGGATAVGDNGGPGQGGAGGTGATSSITGSPVARAGGGGGGGRQPLGGNGTPGAGGSGGGGSGANANTAATAGSTNTGGGGGGAAASSTPPASGQGGGSGVVIIRYKYQN